MSNISKIRSLVQDQPILVQETVTVDGSQTSARCTYFPVVGSSVIVTGAVAPSSVDEQSGLLTWASAPAAADYLLQYSFVQLLDSTIQDFLDLQTSDDANAVILLAAAFALEALATSQVLIQKRIQLLDLKTDGPAQADALRKQAENLRKLVYSEDYVESSFDFAEQVYDTSGFIEKVIKDALREEG